MSSGTEHTRTVVRGDFIELPGVRVRVTPPQGEAFEVEMGVHPLVVGQSAECDVVLADTFASRQHCRIALTPEGILVRDLGSRNGTFVGDVRVIEALIEPGAKVVVGETSLVPRLIGGSSSVPLSSSVRFGEAVGSSVAMRSLFAQLERAARTDETVLLLGESGTGKELLAHALHTESPRKKGPFVVLDCTALAPTLLESELFGHTRGAFTGASEARTGLLEQANGGTLFIDEVGELPLDLQPKLLRALEARKYRPVGAADWRSFDARVVAATHRDLRARVAEGTLRQDLYYRFAVFEMWVPPLRDRREDIALLVERFLSAMTPPRTMDDLPPNAVDILSSHAWPGNVRELRNTVARIVVFPEQLSRSFGDSQSSPQSAPRSRLLGMPIRDARDLVVEEFERWYLGARLAEHGGNVTKAAEAIGVSRQFAHRLLEKHGLRGGEG
ncbi:MAG: sigma 54-interacting transcriptional regulator [Polyangiaceae bacterium]